jgi:DNA polymerase-3 subunit beta
MTYDAQDVPEETMTTSETSPKKATKAAESKATLELTLPTPGALVAQLERVALAVEKRTTIPILENVRIAPAGPDKVLLHGTDLDQHIMTQVACGVVGEGAVTVNAHRLLGIVKKLDKSNPVILGYDGSADASLRSGSAKYTLPILPAAEMPAAPEIEWTRAMAMPAADLLAAIQDVRFAISTEQTRYYLNGIYLHPDPQDADAWLAVATDGHRCAKRSLTPALLGWSPKDCGAEYGGIVPRDAVLNMAKILAKARGKVVFGMFDDAPPPSAPGRAPVPLKFMMHVTTPEGPVTLITRLIDGTFPDYVRVFPTGCDKGWTIASKALQAVIERAKVISTDRSCAVKLTMGQDELTVSVVSPDAGRFEETVACATSDCESVEIGFNAKYLLEFCARGETLRFEIDDAATPAIITMPEDASMYYLLMPVRV